MHKSQSLLKTVFHFNDTDLHANRNGRISDRQKLRLRCMQVLSPLHILSVVLTAIHLVITVHIVAFAIALFQANNWFDFVRVCIGIIVLNAAMIYLIVSMISRIKKLGRDIRKGRVDIAKGAIAFRPYYRNKISFAYRMQIEGKEYPVMWWQTWAFRKHETYSVYVAPHMQLVLSAERVQR
ncbi:MAG: hypothetical protein AAFR31_19865 [Cyanobacteria bacterium J06627_8]